MVRIKRRRCEADARATAARMTSIRKAMRAHRRPERSACWAGVAPNLLLRSAVEEQGLGVLHGAR